MATHENKLHKDFQYTPASRFCNCKNWKMSMRMFPLAVSPIVFKLYFEPSVMRLDWIDAVCFFVPVLIIAAHLIVTWNNRYSFSVNEERITYSTNDILVSSIRWQDVSKVNDWSPYYVKIFSASSRPIAIESWMPISHITRKYINEKIPADKVRYMRFWTRPMHFGHIKKESKGTATAAPGEFK